MLIIIFLKGWKFVLEKVVQLLEHIITYYQAQQQTNFTNQINDGIEEEMLENIMPNGKEVGKCVVVLLAVEVWTDVLDFVKRVDLARTISLTNRHINQICWPCLHGNKVVAHEVREIIIGNRDELGRPPMALLLKDGKEVPIPVSPMPIYISGFHQITIRFLDEQVLAFIKLIFHCIAANAITINLIMGIEMEMSKLGEKQRAYVNQLMQIFREEKSPGIRHLNCRLANIQYLQQVDNQTRSLHLEGYRYEDEALDMLHLMKLLASPRPDGQQRVINLSLIEELARKMVEAIKKEFRASTQALPQPFFLTFYAHNLDIPNCEELNPQTGETLMIVRNAHNDNFDIYRHPTGQHAQWAEDARERKEWTDRVNTWIYVDI